MRRNTFMAERFGMVDVPDSRHLVRELLAFKRRVEAVKVCVAAGDTALVWIYLDLNIDHSAATMAMIKVIAGFLHQSENHFMTVVYPQLHASFKMSTKLKAERMMEDRLLAECLNIDYEARMHYQIEHEHGRGHRRLGAECVSYFQMILWQRTALHGCDLAGCAETSGRLNSSGSRTR